MNIRRSPLNTIRQRRFRRPFSRRRSLRNRPLNREPFHRQHVQRKSRQPRRRQAARRRAAVHRPAVHHQAEAVAAEVTIAVIQTEPHRSYDNNGRYSNSGGDAVSSVKLNYSSKTLEVDDAIQLSAAVSPSNANQSVSWSSSNSAVVSVNNGKITAKKVGKAITVTLYGTSKVTWSVSNSNPVTFTSNKNEAKVKARRKGNTQLYAKDNATGKVYICDIYVG